MKIHFQSTKTRLTFVICVLFMNKWLSETVYFAEGNLQEIHQNLFVSFGLHLLVAHCHSCALWQVVCLAMSIVMMKLFFKQILTCFFADSLIQSPKMKICGSIADFALKKSVKRKLCLSLFHFQNYTVIIMHIQCYSISLVENEEHQGSTSQRLGFLIRALAFPCGVCTFSLKWANLEKRSTMVRLGFCPDTP